MRLLVSTFGSRCMSCEYELYKIGSYAKTLPVCMVYVEIRSLWITNDVVMSKEGAWKDIPTNIPFLYNKKKAKAIFLKLKE